MTAPAAVSVVVRLGRVEGEAETDAPVPEATVERMNSSDKLRPRSSN